MSIFESHADAPDQIREEGQEITLRYSKLEDGVGKLEWNIPPAQSGCKGNGAYDGIVITVSNKPANYIDSSPQNGQYYIGDPSVNPDTHSGSKIEDGVLVVGSFYNDRETTEMEVFDLEPKTPYYFSAYAVDNVARYHREGVHSYSLPSGIEESGQEEATPAKQIVQIEDDITLDSNTGLDPKKKYTIHFKTHCDEYTINLEGRKVLTYNDMLNEINLQMSLLDDIYKSPFYPFKDLIFQSSGEFYIWDGKEAIELDYIKSYTDPNDPDDGHLWFNSEKNKLYLYEDSSTIDGWEEIEFIETDFDITSPSENTIWFDGDDAWNWKHDIWCKLNTIKSKRNPLLPPILSASTYWYNDDTFELLKWNKKLGRWDEAIAIYYPFDPNELLPGSYWFNETDEKVYVLQTGDGGWKVLSNVIYGEDVDPLLQLKNGQFWYIPSDQSLYRWFESWEEKNNITISDSEPSASIGDYWYNEEYELVYVLKSTGWIELKTVSYVDNQEDAFGDYWFDTENEILYKNVGEWEKEDIALFPTDPLNRESCDLWWNSSTSVDYLFIWNYQESQWEAVDTFFQTSEDPAKPPKLPDNTVWFNTVDNVLIRLLNDTCEELEYVDSSINPMEPPIGYVWKWNLSFYQWNGSSWIEISPTRSIIDPFDIPIGTFWLKDNILYQWTDGGWEEVDVGEKSPKPEEEFLWLDTVNDILYEWRGDSWVESKPMVYTIFHAAKCADEKDAIEFRTRKVGCDAKIDIDIRESIFSHLKQRVRYLSPYNGQNLIDGKPMWQRLGVGDDGSPDERRELQTTIRRILGDPATKVELSKAQIDICIDNALKILRKYGGESYKRGFFFLDLNPNQQVYELKDKCVGYHTIVHVNAVYRLRSAFLRGAYSGYDIFGYAALKQLYTLGTFDILSFHMVSSFIEEMEHLFATRITYQWVEKTRELKLYNSIHATERVLVDASIERTEQDLLVDRETNLWIQRWAVAEAKIILSQSRGKFQSLPGASGNTVLNAQELITQSEAEKAVLMDELEDPSMSGALEVGQKGYFILG